MMKALQRCEDPFDRLERQLAEQTRRREKAEGQIRWLVRERDDARRALRDLRREHAAERSARAAKALGVEAPFKSCGCGLSYTEADWSRLERVGVMDDGVDRLELRNCACGSTLAVELPDSPGCCRGEYFHDKTCRNSDPKVLATRK